MTKLPIFFHITKPCGKSFYILKTFSIIPPAEFPTALVGGHSLNIHPALAGGKKDIQIYTGL